MGLNAYYMIGLKTHVVPLLTRHPILMRGRVALIALGVCCLTGLAAAEDRLVSSRIMQKAQVMAEALNPQADQNFSGMIENLAAEESQKDAFSVGAAKLAPALFAPVPKPVPAAAAEPSIWGSIKQFLNENIISPVAGAYQDIVPDKIRGIFGRIFDNLKSIGRAFNHLLQGNFGQAGAEIARFAINSTIGIAGAVDWASEMGIQKKDTSFGETLNTWGVGASSVRDIVGAVMDVGLNPATYLLSPVAGIAFNAASIVATAPEK